MVSHSNSPSPDPRTIPNFRSFGGELRLPGSKSLTQRYFCLALLHRRPLVVHRPLMSEDTRHFLASLEVAGFRVEIEGDRVRLSPGEPDPARSATERRHIDCGAGGTMFRFLSAALTAVPGKWRLDGIPRLRERTVAPLLAALRQLGAKIHCPGEEGFAPLEIDGGKLAGGHCVLDAGSSSQFLSALLLAGTTASATVTVELEALTSEPYVDLTVDAIRELGGTVIRSSSQPPGGACEAADSQAGRALYKVDPLVPEAPGRPIDAAAWPQEVWVEADYSSVAYPAAAAALTGGEVFLPGLRSDSRQGDRGFIALLAQMGAEITWQTGSRPAGSVSGGTVSANSLPANQASSGMGLRVRGTDSLKAISIDMSTMPDQAPTLAALAPFAEGTTRIGNVPHLRIKESDRLAAMASELRKAGAQVEELPDGLIIPGIWSGAEGRRPPVDPVDIATWGDHRIAMAMALVGLRRKGLRIHHPEVVAKSYPDFWRDLEGLLRP